MSVFPFKKAAVTLLLLTAAYFSGFGIHYLFSQPTTVLPASSSSEGNWGLSFQEEGVRPVGNATPSELAKYQAAYADETDEKVIYLTFDAGYENGNLPAILDALKNHQAVGTFFVVGNFLETSPELTKRMVAEGHIVGNHTYHHPDMSKISTKEAKWLTTTAHLRENTAPPTLKWQKNLATKPSSGVSPTWTGFKMSSQQKSRLFPNF